MSCRYKNECPSYSGWCEGPKQDFSRCVEFLITAYENCKKEKIDNGLRLCSVRGEFGYFHTWGCDTSVFLSDRWISNTCHKVYGIVEFSNGIRKVNPEDIQFCDEIHTGLQFMQHAVDNWDGSSKYQDESFWSISDETISKLEEVFGFPFYDWQKDYLKGDNSAMPKSGRGNGKTFAYCLRLLLEKREPFKNSDFRGQRATMTVDEHHGPQYIDVFTHELQDINDKLVKAGFKTNLLK